MVTVPMSFLAPCVAPTHSQSRMCRSSNAFQLLMGAPSRWLCLVVIKKPCTNGMTLEGKKNNSTELPKMLLLATLLQTEAKPNEATAGCLGYHPLVTPQHELLARTAPQVGTPVRPQI